MVEQLCELCIDEDANINSEWKVAVCWICMIFTYFILKDTITLAVWIAMISFNDQKWQLKVDFSWKPHWNNFAIQMNKWNIFTIQVNSFSPHFFLKRSHKLHSSNCNYHKFHIIKAKFRYLFGIKSKVIFIFLCIVLAVELQWTEKKSISDIRFVQWIWKLKIFQFHSIFSHKLLETKMNTAMTLTVWSMDPYFACTDNDWPLDSRSIAVCAFFPPFCFALQWVQTSSVRAHNSSFNNSNRVSMQLNAYNPCIE